MKWRKKQTFFVWFFYYYLIAVFLLHYVNQLYQSFTGLIRCPFPPSATLLSNSALCANLNTLGSPVQWPSRTVFLTLKSRIILFLFAPILLYWSWASVNTIPMCDLAIPIWTQHFLCFAPTERAVYFYPLSVGFQTNMYLCTWAIIC